MKMLYGDFVGNDSSIFMLIAMLGYMHAKTAGYPIGGSLAFAKRIEQKYLDLGGKIYFKKRNRGNKLSVFRITKPSRRTKAFRK